jgi:predicted transglutaminase-like cysteine proteinase
MNSTDYRVPGNRSKLLRRGVVACVLGLTAVIGTPSLSGWTQAEAAVKSRPGIFNSVEVRKKGLKPFPKWTGALDRYVKESAKKQGKCKPTKKKKCYYANWLKTIDGLKKKGPWEQIKGVNKMMNRAPYVVDKMNWGIKDYWSTPGQFFARYGDCEDYAIVKFLSLRALGIPSSQMRVVVVQDLNLKVAHAVLALYIRGKVLVLDNQIKKVVEAKSIRHYRPIFSLNEEGWWMHRKGSKNKKRKKKRKKKARS